MKLRKRKIVAAAAALVGVSTLLAIWYLVAQPQNSRFELSNSWQRFYSGAGVFAHRIGLTRAGLKLDQLRIRAQESHLRRAVQSGQLGLVLYNQPGQPDFGHFSNQILELAKREGFTVFFIRPVPNPMNPKAYEVFVEKAGEQHVRTLITSPAFKLPTSPYE